MEWHHAFWVALAVAAVAWVLRAKGRPDPDTKFVENTPPPRLPDMKGLPEGLLQKMQNAVDRVIPVVMTAGAPTLYDDAEIQAVVRLALDRVNAQDESLALLAVASASKTVDSYKTIAYDVIANVFDAKGGVGLLVQVGALVPATDKVYVRELKLYNDRPDPMPGLKSGADPAGPAAFEDPLDALARMRPGETPAAPAQAAPVR